MELIVVDSSALLAILFKEREREAFMRSLDKADQSLMSCVNYAETAVVLEARLGENSRPRLDALISGADIQIESATPAHARAVRDVYRRFGKGQHKAKLNFADCFAYALARRHDAPLLYKGNDFAHTDILSAIPRETPS